MGDEQTVEAPKKKRGRPAQKKDIAETAKVIASEIEKNPPFDTGVDDIRNISVTSRKRVSLANPEFDPFTKFKTDPNMYYRALNNRATNITKREAEGYKLIPEAKYGDLILGCMPKDNRAEREAYVKEKTEKQKQASVEQFKEAAHQGGIKSYEEK